ncbi:c-type cytochrome [Kordiimonas pumila]|uniref:C-type cytochrome n=1 Tax=Kordiimonas pumila TaxID=2161677 RepID=A0ABV7D325_9PROT|nr:c-type cytochrome [Kordiimonas pumila]
MHKLTLFCAVVIGLLLPVSAAAHETVGSDAEIQAWTTGAKAFVYCANCHTINGTEKMRFGPDLLGIVGRPVASLAEYSYSDALHLYGGIWSKERLNRFIAKPDHAVKGTKMPYAGLLSPHARADLIEYLDAVGKMPRELDTGDILSKALLEGNADHGSVLFTPCLACHNAEKGLGHKIGPNLSGIIGRKIASSENFEYSERLRRRGGYWTPEALNAFFFEVKEFDQGSHMAFLRLTRLKDRADLIAWLNTL